MYINLYNLCILFYFFFSFFTLSIRNRKRSGWRTVGEMVNLADLNKYLKN